MLKETFTDEYALHTSSTGRHTGSNTVSYSKIIDSSLTLGAGVQSVFICEKSSLASELLIFKCRHLDKCKSLILLLFKYGSL